MLRGMEALLNDNEKDELWATVDEQSRGLLCRHLCNEIQVYKKILSASVNLNEKQVQEASEELEQFRLQSHYAILHYLISHKNFTNAEGTLVIKLWIDTQIK